MQNQRLRPGVCQKRFHIAKHGPPLRKRYEPKNDFMLLFVKCSQSFLRGSRIFLLQNFINHQVDVEIGHKRLYNGFVTERRGFYETTTAAHTAFAAASPDFLLCLLCGCSVRQPDTRLTLNPDGSGERIINCVIANNRLSKNRRRRGRF